MVSSWPTPQSPETHWFGEIDCADGEIVPQGFYAARLPDLESCAIKWVQPVPDKEPLFLLSDNPKYPPEPVSWHEHLLIGCVIWSWTIWVRLGKLKKKISGLVK